MKMNPVNVIAPLITMIRVYCNRSYSFVFDAGYFFIVLCALTAPFMPLSYMIIYRDADSVIRSINSSGGVINLFISSWSSVKWYDIESWCIIIFTIVLSTLSNLFPGYVFYGPTSLSGFRPCYKKSAGFFYSICLAIIIPLLWCFSVLHLYYSFTSFSGILWMLTILLSVYLFFKGNFDPSPGVFGSFENPVKEFIYGLELYPRLGPTDIFDLKTIIHCRFSYILWQAIVLWAWKANYELHHVNYLRGEINWPMTSATILQTTYIACYFFCEEACLSSNIVSNTKFGLALASHSARIVTFNSLISLYLIKYAPIHLFGPVSFVIVTLTGFIFIILRFAADSQRLKVKDRRGKCTIFGKKPVIIHAVYSSFDGTTHQSQLLASGLWGNARHFNYLCEWMAVLCWSLTTMSTSLIIYLPLIDTTYRLLTRSAADEDKCEQKYGKYWDRYCAIARYKIIPFVY